MTDKEMYEILEKFANGHSLAIGGDIKVVLTPHSQEMKPLSETQYMKYEDVEWLHEIIRGAMAFMFWARRNGYQIKKVKHDRNKKTNL